MKANNSINTPGAKAIAIDLVKTDLVEHIKIHPKFSSCHQNTAGCRQQAEHNKVPRRLGRLKHCFIQSGIQIQQQEQLTRCI